MTLLKSALDPASVGRVVLEAATAARPSPRY